MSTKKIHLFLFSVLVILTSNSTLNAKTELASKKSSLQKTINVQLLQVFIIEKDAMNLFFFNTKIINPK